MKFGEALELEMSICRKGWNGKGMFVIQVDLFTLDGVKIDNKCLILKNVTGKFNTWVPSITDIFAEDWEVAK